MKGLVLRIMPTGSKSWIYCYSVKEGDKWRERRNGLGPFRQGRNDAAGLTVPAARRGPWHPSWQASRPSGIVPGVFNSRLGGRGVGATVLPGDVITVGGDGDVVHLRPDQDQEGAPGLG